MRGTTNLNCFILIVCLVSFFSCSSYNMGKKDAATFGRYKLEYHQNRAIPEDSVMIRMELYSFYDNSPIKFAGAKYPLGKFIIEEEGLHIRTMYMRRRDVPEWINVEVADKLPLHIRTVLKRNRQLTIKAYFSNDIRGKM